MMTRGLGEASGEGEGRGDVEEAAAFPNGCGNTGRREEVMRREESAAEVRSEKMNSLGWIANHKAAVRQAPNYETPSEKARFI